MAAEVNRIEVYLEIGQKRTFAIAPVWPGWCRSGRDEASALQSLYDYAPRYALALGGTSLDFPAPSEIADLLVVERLPGNATTDFGAPDLALPGDKRPIDLPELQRFQSMLEACWRTFDKAVQGAAGKALRKGPRGSGRELDKIVAHVHEVDLAYLSALGGKLKISPGDDPHRTADTIRQAVLTTLAAAVRGEIAARGPRGGARWTPRYFVRRLAWHELDHAWEIEDRAE